MAGRALTGGPVPPATVPALLATAAAVRPQAVAHVVDGGESLTFGGWERRSDDVARGLVARGVQAGDRVALVFDRARWLDLAVTYVGAHKAGVVAVPLGRRPGLDLNRVLDHCGAAGVVSPGDVAPGAYQGWAATPAELESAGSAGPLPTAPTAGDIAEILYAPGAMRLPEARARSHHDLVSSAAGTPVLPGSLLHAVPVGSTSGTEALIAPLRDGYGTTVALPRFDVGRLCALVAEGGARSAALPSSVCRMLLGPDLDGGCLSSLPHLLVHGDALPSLQARLAVAFPHTSVTCSPTTASPPGPRAGVVGSAPVPPFLEGMVWHEQFAPGSFNLAPLVRRYRGRLDVAAMEAALNEIVRRHDSLRSTFTIADGLPVQLVWSPRPLLMPLVDLSGLAPSDGNARLALIIGEARTRPMDMVTGPLFQPTLIRLGTDDHVLVVRVHISVYDDFSVGPFRRELSALYTAYRAGEPSPLPDLPLQFADVCRAQRQMLDGPKGDAQRSFWARELAGAPLSVQLPVDDPGQPAGGAHGATEPLTLEVGPEVTAGLRSLARQERSTLFMVVLAAFGVVLQRYTGQDDLLVSTLVGNRTRPELEGMIGCFSKKVLVRLRLSGDPTFCQLVGRTRSAVVGALANQDLSYEDVLQGRLGPDAAAHGLTPQVGVKFQAAVAAADKLSLPGLTPSAAPLALPAGQRHFLAGPDHDQAVTERPDAPWGGGLYLRTFLGLYLSEVDGRLRLVTEGVFHPPAVERLLGHFHTLLTDIAADPARPVSQLSLLDTRGRTELLEQFNATLAELPAHECLHHAVATVAARVPDRVAVVSGEATVTYAQLEERADRLAGQLAEIGVGPGALVGICLEPGSDVVVAVLGIWKTGAAFVAFDPGDGEDHVAAVLADAGIETLVAAPGVRLPGGHDKLTVIGPPVDHKGDGATGRSAVGGRADDLACVFYGSGATAVAHGVEIGHRSLVNVWAGLRRSLHGSGASADGPALRLCFGGVPTADGFLRQLVGLADGHSLHIPQRPLADDPSGVVRLVREARVDVVECTPNELARLLGAGLADALVARPGGAPRPVVVLASREPIDLDLWEDFRRLPGVDVHHLYGPPGCSFAATVCRAGAPGRPSIGHPLANVRSYVLDHRNEPVPVGVCGQLHLAGAALARGYRGRPDLTEERFAADPFAADGPGRLHGTRQVARRLPDGGIELVGDVAGLVDLRGFRVEPARIEASLAGCPGVRHAEIVVTGSGPGDRRLVAHVVPEDPSRPPTLDDIRRFLWTTLPGYAWPAELVVAEAPHRGSGHRAGTAPPRAPGGPADGVPGEARLLASAWADARSIDKADQTDNYWQSFSFLDALSEAQGSGVAVSAVQVTRNRTVQALAVDLATQREPAGHSAG